MERFRTTYPVPKALSLALMLGFVLVAASPAQARTMEYTCQSDCQLEELSPWNFEVELPDDSPGEETVTREEAYGDLLYMIQGMLGDYNRRVWLDSFVNLERSIPPEVMDRFLKPLPAYTLPDYTPRPLTFKVIYYTPPIPAIGSLGQLGRLNYKEAQKFYHPDGWDPIAFIFEGEGLFGARPWSWDNFWRRMATVSGIALLFLILTELSRYLLGLGRHATGRRGRQV